MRKNHNRIDGITRERIRNRGSNRTGVVRAFVMRLHRKLSLITSIAIRMVSVDFFLKTILKLLEVNVISNLDMS